VRNIDCPRVLRDAARYMGIKVGAAPAGFLERAESIYEELKSAERPKSVWRIFPIETVGGAVKFGGAFEIAGGDLERACRDCDKAVLLAATLGASVDRLINKTQALDMSDAVILDACASAEIERICDIAEAEMEPHLDSAEYLAPRYSPGYGDVPLGESAKIIDALDAVRRIGLSVTKSGMLVPVKSVTAVIGISKSRGKRGGGCEICSMYGECSFAERGEGSAL
jgi:hypothetical protein